jgi:hypothetical protein
MKAKRTIIPNGFKNISRRRKKTVWSIGLKKPLKRKLNNWKIKKSIFKTLEEEGPSMFYTSIVLLFGFSVFTLSDFGGTIALGGLVSITLLFGMLTNLILLPSLVLSLNKTLANQQELKEPTLEIIVDDAEIEKEIEKNTL